MGMILPTAALSAEPQIEPAAPSLDVALGAEGLFRGQLVDAQGVPQQGVEVAMLYQGQEVVRSVTDQRGVFAAKGLRGGQYQVVAQNHVANYRLWNAGAAPPVARPAALMVTGSDVVNGQLGGNGGLLQWMKNHPMMVATGVVAAIAVPVAVTASDDDSSS